MSRRVFRCGGCGAGEQHSVTDYVQSMRVCTRCGVVSRELIRPQSDGFVASERSTVASANIGSANSFNERTRTLARSEQRTRTPRERQTIKMRSVVEALAERLGLNTRLVEETQRVVLAVRRVHNRKVKKDELMAAACIAIACRTLRFPRTFKDVAQACGSVTTKELGRTFKVLSRALGGNHAHEQLRAMVPRFAATAGFKGGDVMLSEHVAAAGWRRGVVHGGNPLSIIAGSLLMVARLREANDIDCERISLTVGVAETTTRKSFNALRDTASSILPSAAQRKFGVLGLSALWRESAPAVT